MLTLLPLPPRALELAGQENIWQFMQQNWLSNRVFKPSTTSSIIAAMPETPLSIRPWKIMSIAIGAVVVCQSFKGLDNIRRWGARVL
jgi:hypothetical protein